MGGFWSVKIGNPDGEIVCDAPDGGIKFISAGLTHLVEYHDQAVYLSKTEPINNKKDFLVQWAFVLSNLVNQANAVPFDKWYQAKRAASAKVISVARFEEGDEKTATWTAHLGQNEGRMECTGGTGGMVFFAKVEWTGAVKRIYQSGHATGKGSGTQASHPVEGVLCKKDTPPGWPTL